MNKKNLDLWKTKNEAAAILGCSVKTVDRLAAAGKIKKQERRVPGRRPLPVFNPKDIERKLEESAVLKAVPVSEQGSGGALMRQQKGNGAEFFAQFAASMANPQLRLGEKVYLTLGEASAYSGLSRTLLLRKVKSGEVKAFKDGGWKIRRSELEEL